jgi:hypothetical protein
MQYNNLQIRESPASSSSIRGLCTIQYRTSPVLDQCFFSFNFVRWVVCVAIRS